MENVEPAPAREDHSAAGMELEYKRYERENRTMTSHETTNHLQKKPDSLSHVEHVGTPVSILSLNPAVDITYTVPRLIVDQKAHAVSTRFDPGGNGINVGRALKRLGIMADSFCVTAGETGHLLERLLVNHLDTVHYERVDGETRINGTIQEQESGIQYEVSGIGPPVPARQLASLLNTFVQHAGRGFGVLTGSILPDLSIGLYADLVGRIREAGGFPVVDTHHESLRRAITARPFLVKPNRHELETLTHSTLSTPQKVAEQARRIQQQGVDFVCISLGGEGALLTSSENTFYAEALKVKVESTVGAGDSMVAGLLAAFVRGLSCADTLRLAVACGSGTVEQAGTELFSTDAIATLSKRIKIKTMNI